jgi:hypothetical protein
MTKKFVLSTGRTTTKIEEYILDLFKLYLSVNPGDIQYLPEFGFNFTFAGIPKADLPDKIQFRMESFVKKVSESFPGTRIVLEELSMISEETVRATISVNGTTSDNIFVNIYENS